MPAGAFDALDIGTVRLERRLEVGDAPTRARVVEAVRAWLAL